MGIHLLNTKLSKADVLLIQQLKVLKSKSIVFKFSIFGDLGPIGYDFLGCDRVCLFIEIDLSLLWLNLPSLNTRSEEGWFDWEPEERKT